MKESLSPLRNYNKAVSLVSVCPSRPRLPQDPQSASRRRCGCVSPSAREFITVGWSPPRARAIRRVSSDPRRAARAAANGRPMRPPAMCIIPPMGNRCQGPTAIGSACRSTTLTATWSAGAGVQWRLLLAIRLSSVAVALIVHQFCR